MREKKKALTLLRKAKYAIMISQSKEITTVDALWVLIQNQTKAVRQALVRRLLAEETKTKEQQAMVKDKPYEGIRPAPFWSDTHRRQQHFCRLVQMEATSMNLSVELKYCASDIHPLKKISLHFNTSKALSIR